MKQVAWIFVAVGLMVTSVQAQTRITPDGFGGYNIDGPNGTSRMVPDGFGGYDVIGRYGTSRVIPQGSGSYEVIGPRYAMPNSGGGYNIVRP